MKVHYSLPITIHDERADSLHILYDGSTCKIGGLEITVKSIEDNYRVKDDEYDLYTPKEGYKYIATTLTKKKKKNNKTRKDYTTDKNFDWYIRNAKPGDPFSFTMEVTQKIDDNTFLCDVNSDVTSDMVFVYIDKEDYTKEITGGKKIIEDDMIRVYGEFIDTYIYTTAIGGSKEALQVNAVFIDIQ